MEKLCKTIEEVNALTEEGYKLEKTDMVTTVINEKICENIEKMNKFMEEGYILNKTITETENSIEKVVDNIFDVQYWLEHGFKLKKVIKPFFFSKKPYIYHLQKENNKTIYHLQKLNKETIYHMTKEKYPQTIIVSFFTNEIQDWLPKYKEWGYVLLSSENYIGNGGKRTTKCLFGITDKVIPVDER